MKRRSFLQGIGAFFAALLPAAWTKTPHEEYRDEAVTSIADAKDGSFFPVKDLHSPPDDSNFKRLYEIERSKNSFPSEIDYMAADWRDRLSWTAQQLRVAGRRKDAERLELHLRDPLKSEKQRLELLAGELSRMEDVPEGDLFRSLVTHRLASMTRTSTHHEMAMANLKKRLEEYD